ncbi:bifunctional diguanylate cyclase/phosphodiesterase [Planococcus donghaensis]|uniref:Sensor domain-containing diguanylate cyclase n=1 Tax=Planococcus donghaensis TaxID=414778 RepID=A0A1C7EGX2_9BACL|nr:sensor domain-containing diguanylate cyclase [Planococcus donghaensis]ANU22602.1 sensor domain-containing diguanylate cyclase [Planococcus donghaensis]
MEKEATSLSFMRILMEGIKEMVFVVEVDEAGSFTYDFFNQAVLEKTVLTPDSKGKTFSEVYPEEMANFLYERYREVIKTNEKKSYEDSFYTKENRLLYSETLLTPLYNETGKCTHIVSLVKDITNEKQAKLESEKIRERLEISSARYQSLYDSNASAIFTLDFTGSIIGGNSASLEISGYSKEELLAENFVCFITGTDQKLAKEHFLLSKRGEVDDIRLQIVKKSGALLSCLVKFIPINVKGTITGFYMSAKDMTELDAISGLYKAGEENFQIIAENVHDVIVLMDQYRQYLYVSPSSENIFGFKADSIVQKEAYYQIHAEDIKRVRNSFDYAAKNSTTFREQLRLLHKNRGWIWTEVAGTPVLGEDKKFNHMVIVARDISTQKEYENRLRHFAYFDALTELPNRRYFQEYVTEKLNMDEQSRKGLAVLILDIDDFKQINDQWGHEIGDGVIQEFGHRLNRCIQGDNIAARLGGDEFVVLLTEIENEAQVTTKAEAIYQAMQMPINVCDLSFEISISMGITMAPDEGTSISTMMKRADLAMYQAKRKEKNTYHLSLT